MARFSPRSRFVPMASGMVDPPKVQTLVSIGGNRMKTRSLPFALCAFVLTWNTEATAQVWSAEKTQIADFYGAAAVAAHPGAVAITPSLAVGVSIGGTPVL